MLATSYGVIAIRNIKSSDIANASDIQLTLIPGTTYENTILTGATFEEALIGKEDVKRLCANPTAGAITRPLLSST